eukprot:8297472-Pyramimonas_sp.AAC.1
MESQGTTSRQRSCCSSILEPTKKPACAPSAWMSWTRFRFTRIGWNRMGSRCFCNTSRNT